MQQVGHLVVYDMMSKWYICCSDNIYLLESYFSLYFFCTFFLSNLWSSVCSNKCDVHLVFECVQGLLPAIVLQTLSDPAVNRPTSQIPTVWTVAEPSAMEKRNTKQIKKAHFSNIPRVQTKSLVCRSVDKINAASQRKAQREIYWFSQKHKNSRDFRGRSKQEKSAVAPNKDEQGTESQPKQTNQTGDSFQKKHHRAEHAEKARKSARLRRK